MVGLEDLKSLSESKRFDGSMILSFLWLQRGSHMDAEPSDGGETPVGEQDAGKGEGGSAVSPPAGGGGCGLQPAPARPPGCGSVRASCGPQTMAGWLLSGK